MNYELRIKIYEFRIRKVSTRKILYLLVIVLCGSCMRNTKTVKIQKKRDNIIYVREKVKEIEIEDVIISRRSQVYLIDNYLIINDQYFPFDKCIHLFDKNDFSYVTSTGDRGPGPNELTIVGEIGVNEADRIFYVSDHGKVRIFKFDLDSVLADPNYYPKESIKLDNTQFPSDYQYINDTLSIGLFILPISNSDYRPSVAKWNMKTGKITLLNKYDHPEIERKRVRFAVSMEHGIFVECYWHHDLMTICDLDGNLKYYIYGRKWDNTTQNRINFYNSVTFCKDKIVALYSDGENNFIREKNGVARANYPTKLIVFDLNGDYIKTLETGYQIINFCYDKDNHRIIMVLDDEIQFAYLSLEGIL